MIKKEKKNRIIDEIKKGADIANLVDKYGVGKSTLYKWRDESQFLSKSKYTNKDLPAPFVYITSEKSLAFLLLMILYLFKI